MYSMPSSLNSSQVFHDFCRLVIQSQLLRGQILLAKNIFYNFVKSFDVFLKSIVLIEVGIFPPTAFADFDGVSF